MAQNEPVEVHLTLGGRGGYPVLIRFTDKDVEIFCPNQPDVLVSLDENQRYFVGVSHKGKVLFTNKIGYADG